MSEKEKSEFRQASDPDCHEDRLSELTHSESELVRAAVASNISTKTDDLLVLSKDESDYVLNSLQLRKINEKLSNPPTSSISKLKH